MSTVALAHEPWCTSQSYPDEANLKMRSGVPMTRSWAARAVRWSASATLRASSRAVTATPRLVLLMVS